MSKTKGQPNPALCSRWFRGQLHVHSYWSDGRDFPEQAVAAYMDRGYHFLCISDHNRFATDVNDWREVHAEEGSWPPKITADALIAYQRRFGEKGIDVRREEGKTFVRLKAFDEVRAEFEREGVFLLLPGCELTQSVGRVALHVNVINLPQLPASVRDAPYVKKVDGDFSVSDVMSMNFQEVGGIAESLGLPHLFIVDHPLWSFCDLVPQDILNCPEIRYFEICNNGSRFPANPEMGRYDCEVFWDAVNAFRCRRGEQLLFGIGSDDAHFYDSERIGGNNGVGDAWVSVRADELNAGSLIAAMNRGDFYASCGVELEDVEFVGADRTLRVKVKAVAGVDYRIDFITTGAGFDDTVGVFESHAAEGRPARRIPVYSDDIGRVAKTVDGAQGEYTMAVDDLYVRARIESSVPSRNSCLFHPRLQCAWTQPWR